MSTFLIREENMKRLEKKLATIRTKCKDSHCSFKYSKIGEAFKEDESGNIYKYIEVEVEGVAQYNGWRFVATLDHHEEGNVIRAYDTELVIPEKYKTCGPTCEHCSKIRSRKDTYLIYNDERSEFKQVGKSCLQEFTNGLSAENIAFFCSIYEKMEDSGFYSGTSYNRYIEVEGILRYAFECYKHWGYQKSYSWEEIPYSGYRSTKDRVSDYYWIKRLFSKEQDKCKAEMKEVGFDASSDYAVESTTKALEWIRNIENKELGGNDYLRNLHVICSDNYTDYRSLGILVSLTAAYARHIGQLEEYKKKEEAQKKLEKSSEYVGEIGERIIVNVISFNLVSSWDTLYGTTYLYKFTDDFENVFIWYASNGSFDSQSVVTVKGTVKDHSEFNGVKQTVLTRCKVITQLDDEFEKIKNDQSVMDVIGQFLDACEA